MLGSPRGLSGGSFEDKSQDNWAKGSARLIRWPPIKARRVRNETRPENHFGGGTDGRNVENRAWRRHSSPECPVAFARRRKCEIGTQEARGESAGESPAKSRPELTHERDRGTLGNPSGELGRPSHSPNWSGYGSFGNWD